MKNKFLVVLTLVVLFATTCTFAVTFTDLPQDHWAINYVTPLAEAGVINGYPNGTFEPEGTIARGEFLKLVIAASLPEGVDIKTAPSALDHWAGQYLFVAQQYQIVAPGTITLENIDLPITRREMVMMIGKADTSWFRQNKLNNSNSVTFADFSLFDSSELKYLTHSVSEGYLNGYPDGTFGPDNNMTRAEASTVIYRYTNKGK